MVQASWLDMNFEMNPEGGLLSLFNNFSVSSKIVNNANNDAAGQSKSDTVSRDLTTISIDIKVLSSESIDARGVAEEWDVHLGDYAPLYVGGKKLLFDNFQLTSVKWDPKFMPDGTVDSVSINLEFTEYAPEKSSEKKPSATTSKKSSTKTSSKKPMDIDKNAVAKADKRVNGYTSKVDVGASMADKKGL